MDNDKEAKKKKKTKLNNQTLYDMEKEEAAVKRLNMKADLCGRISSF